MRIKTPLRSTFPLAVLMLIAACGGGGGGAGGGSGGPSVVAPAANNPPTANAGVGQTVRPYVDTLTLDGSGSADKDGDTLTYSWSITSKPEVSTATLSSTTAVRPTLEPDAVGKFVFSLTVSDGKGGSASSSVEVTSEFGPTYTVAQAQSDFTSANPSTIAAAIDFVKNKRLNAFHADFLSKRAPGTTIFYALENNISAPSGGASIAGFSLDFESVVELPTQLSAISYPGDYQKVTPKVSIVDPFCNNNADKIYYPTAYLSGKSLPNIAPKPLSSTIARVVQLKDVWGKPNKQGYSHTPNFTPGCVNDVRVNFQRTIARLKQLNADTIVLIPWTVFDGSKDPWRVENPAETLSSTIGDEDLRWIVAEARRNNLKAWVSVQIQGARKTANQGGSSQYWLSTEATQERVLKSYDALDIFLEERGKFYQDIGVDGVILGGWYWAGFEGVLPSATYLQRTEQKIKKLKVNFKGSIIYYASDAVAKSTSVSSVIDIFAFSPSNSFSAEQVKTITVDQLKQEYLRQAEGFKGFGVTKPVLWSIGAPSRADYFDSGYLEETFCTAGFGLDGSAFSNKCIQRDKVVDLGLQAMIYEAQLRALSEQRALNIVGVTTNDYWMDSNLMPSVTFSNLGYSIRGKPAEYIVYKWFAK